MPAIIELDSISLPVDLLWSDEFTWSNVSQNVKRSLTGSLVIQEASQTKGRLITLEGDESSAWITRATLKLLKLKYDTPDLTMSLNINGDIYSVRFKRDGNVSPLDITEIYGLSDPDDQHIYSITLRFIEV